MAEATFSLDLHVLSPPLTFALSQDQTLHRKVLNPALRRSPGQAQKYAVIPRENRVRRGMVSLHTETSHSSIDLLSSFQRPIPRSAFSPGRYRLGDRFLFGFLGDRVVEGCCL